MHIWQSLGTKLYLKKKIKFLSKSLLFATQVIQINKRYPIGPGLKWKQPKVKIISAHMLRANQKIYQVFNPWSYYCVSFPFFPFLCLFSFSLPCFAFMRSPSVSCGIVLTPVRTGRLVKMSWVDGIMTHSKLKCLNFQFPLFFSDISSKHWHNMGLVTSYFNILYFLILALL